MIGWLRSQSVSPVVTSLKPEAGHDVAGERGVDVLAVVGVHQQQATDALALLLDGVVELLALADLARVDPEVRELAEGIANDLERQRGERLVLVRLALDDLLAVQAGALRRRDVERARQVVDDGVEHGLHALVLERRAAQDRDEAERQRALAQTEADLVLGERLVVEVLLHQRLVLAGDEVEQLGPVLLGLGAVLGGDVALFVGGALVLALPHDRLHLDEVDDAQEVGLGAERQLDDGRDRLEAGLDHAERAEEVGADAVHLVDEAHARHAVLVGLAPDGLGLRLDTGDRVEHCDGTVEDAQRALDLDGEVDVAGGVDDVDAVVAPERGGGGGRDRDATLLFLRHVVHDGTALVHLTDLVGLAGVVEDALGRRRLAGIDVGHDADVAVALEGVLTLGHRWGHFRIERQGAPGPEKRCVCRRRGRETRLATIADGGGQNMRARVRGQREGDRHELRSEPIRRRPGWQPRA